MTGNDYQTPIQGTRNSDDTNCTVTYGIAAEDKVPGSVNLKVYPKEGLPLVEGNLEATTSKSNIKLKTPSGNTSSSKVELSNIIESVYFGGMPYLTDPPDIFKGEQIELRNYDNTDVFYWLPMARNPDYRKCEHLILCNSDRTKVEAPTIDNEYRISIITIQDKKEINITTCKNDKEEYRYQILIDAKNSQVTIRDDGENIIQLESKIPRIWMQNRDKSTVDLDKKDIFITAPRDVIIKAGRQMVLDTPILTGSVQEGSGVTVFNVKAVTINAANNATIVSPCIGLQGAVVAKTIVAEGITAGSYNIGTP